MPDREGFGFRVRGGVDVDMLVGEQPKTGINGVWKRIAEDWGSTVMVIIR
jgi:hypothetical protein